mgnify:CR=1 FL=1
MVKKIEKSFIKNILWFYEKSGVFYEKYNVTEKETSEGGKIQCKVDLDGRMDFF